MKEAGAPVPGRLLLGAVGVLLATVLGRGAAMAAAAAAQGLPLAEPGPDSPGLGWLLAAGLVGGSTLGGAALWWVARRDLRGVLAARPLSGGALALWTLAGVALAAALDGAAWAAGRPLLQPEWLAAWRTAPALALAAALILTSLFEELYFRGLLHGALAARLGPWPAVAITAALFAASHVPQDGWRFGEVFLTGALLGLARHRTGSSLAGMAPHVLGNLKVLVLLALHG